MSSLLNFLNRVLPLDGEGVRCWFTVKKGSPPVQNFSSNNEELAGVLRGIDSRKLDAYFACASFKDRSSRKAENAQAVKAFWLDIDVGELKPYKTQQEALAAFRVFLEKTRLPPASLLVCSGYGFHVYWCLENLITPETWRPVAKALKRLTEVYNFNTDDSRTADLASVLRPIETLNWKNPDAPKEVYILEEGADVSFTAFAEIVSGKKTDNPVPALLQAVPNFDFGLMPKGPPSMTQGYGDGERTQAMMHRIGYCFGPARMTVEDALQACLAWNEYNTPPLDKEKITEAVYNINKREMNKSPADVASSPFENPSQGVPPLPFGFRWGRDLEIMMTIKNKDYNPEDPHQPEYIDVLLSKYPFYIESLREEETHGTKGVESVKITCRTPHSPWKSFVAARGKLRGPNGVEILENFGVACQPGMEKPLRALLLKMIEQKVDTMAQETAYKSFGWKDNRTKFISGRRCFSKTGATNVSGTGEFEKAADLLSPNPGGSIGKWRSAMNQLCAPGSEAQLLAVISSFSSPLMDMVFTGMEGGTILSLRSDGSGKGKSTAIAAAESVWGQKNCIRITEKESSAAKFRAIGIRGHLPVTMDEWGRADVKAVADFVATFTGGLDKKRLAITGEDIREQLSWKSVLIGTTNDLVVDTLRQNGYGPESNRIFEIDMDIVSTAKYSQASTLLRDFEDNGGFAGPIFMAYLLANYDLQSLQTKVNDLANELGKRINADQDERFKIRLIAANHITATILSRPMINGEPMFELDAPRFTNYALDLVKTERKNRGGKKTPVDHLNDFILANSHLFVGVPKPYNNKVPYLDSEVTLPRGGLIGRYERENGKLYIPQETMHKFAVSVRVGFTEFSKQLNDSGVVLNRNRRTALSAGVKALGPVTVSCWEIDLFHELLAEIKSEIEVKELKTK